MKRGLVTGLIVLSALLIALPGTADDEEGEGWWGCRIEGTWFGQNSSGVSYIFRIERNAAGEYTLVADGFTDDDLAPAGCTQQTLLHGELARLDGRTFGFRQLSLCDPDPLVYGFSTPILLGVFAGTLELVGCNELEAEITTVAAYFLRPDIVPFVTPFDFDIPGVTTGTFTRMPPP